jgi:hypothetical protein
MDNDTLLSRLDNPDQLDEQTSAFSLNLTDRQLYAMLTSELDKDIEYWNKPPWSLQDTDKRNVSFLLGEQQEKTLTVLVDGMEFTNNRLFTGLRAILSYATGNLAKPDLGPSNSNDAASKLAKGLAMSLYEHSLDEDADDLFRMFLLSLCVRKRAWLKLRYDPYKGTDGDVVTDYVNPEDGIPDRFATFNSDPNRFTHRLRCSLDELVARFPGKKKEIFAHYGIVRGVQTQMSREITYYETWFSYIENNVKQQAVAWFIKNSDGLILDKMRNPNWLYDGTAEEQLARNVTDFPPKPFIHGNYLTVSNSFIDETCLFDQAIPLQKLINKLIKQITDNADYVNGRWVYNKNAIDEADATRFTMAKAVNNALGVKHDDVGKAILNISSAQLPSYIWNTLQDAYHQLDSILGTPSQFRGETPSSQDTLGRDQMVKQQAGALQDDLVRAVAKSEKRYYKLKLQLMAVNYGENHVFSQKGGNGDYQYFAVSEDSIDPNVKFRIETDSNLPIDKVTIRNMALQLAKPGLIDPLTLFGDLGLPDADIRAERLLNYRNAPIGYMQSISTDMQNSDAELDIMLVTAGKTPDERDNYDERYLTYWNNFTTTNRFAMLPADAKQRLVIYLQFIQQKVAQAADLQGTQVPTVDAAGMLPYQPPAPPPPKVQLEGKLDASQSAQLAGVQPSQPQAPTQVNPQTNNGGL